MAVTRSLQPPSRSKMTTKASDSKSKEKSSSATVPRRSSRKKTSNAFPEREESQTTSIDANQLSTEPQYKDETNAFSAPPGDGQDFISAAPPEILDHIFSFCLRDHDPEHAVKEKAAADEGNPFHAQSHVLISLAAMSKHFRDQVEGFSRRLLLKNKALFRFKTSEELKQEQQAMNRRRSARLQAQPAKFESRVYRKELVYRLNTYCINCDSYAYRPSTMMNKVSFCSTCERRNYGSTINLTDARTKYNWRDWMLIATRHPGPRARKNHLELPTIRYCTIRASTPLMSGKRLVSYRFYVKDVERIATLVHGDFKEHMEQRRADRNRKIHRKLKIRKHKDRLESDNHHRCKEYHRKRLDHFQAADWDENYDSDDSTHSSYGGYGDTHAQFCDDPSCYRCMEDKMVKYTPWFYGEYRDPWSSESDWSDDENPRCGAL